MNYISKNLLSPFQKTLTQTIRIETATALTSLYVSLYAETTTTFCYFLHFLVY